jgi:hypothetical protein
MFMVVAPPCGVSRDAKSTSQNASLSAKSVGLSVKSVGLRKPATQFQLKKNAIGKRQKVDGRSLEAFPAGLRPGKPKIIGKSCSGTVGIFFCRAL